MLACLDCEENALKEILDGGITKNDVIVIRYEGPKGGPGMREMLSPTSAVMGKGLGNGRSAYNRRSIFRRNTWFCGWTHYP